LPPLRIAVTGGGGYVGLRLLPVLAAHHGVSVRALTRRPCPVPPNVVQLIGDVLDRDGTLERLCAGADAIVHLAGPNEVQAATDPERAVAEVVTGAMRVASAAVAAEIGKLVYLSTVHVYGAQLQARGRVDEETRCEPRSPYAIARLAAEHLLATFGPPRLIVFRVTNAVGAPAGPGSRRWSLVANDLSRQGAVTGRLRLRTDGSQRRDFVSLTDVCLITATAAITDELEPATYNLGMGASLTVRELAGLVQDGFVASGVDRPPLEAPEPLDPPANFAEVSVDRLARAGFRPARSVRGAVEETVRFCLDHRSDL
jgi:UDP-glucose 4-epimerase